MPATTNSPQNFANITSHVTFPLLLFRPPPPQPRAKLTIRSEDCVGGKRTQFSQPFSPKKLASKHYMTSQVATFVPHTNAFGRNVLTVKRSNRRMEEKPTRKVDQTFKRLSWEQFTQGNAVIFFFILFSKSKLIHEIDFAFIFSPSFSFTTLSNFLARRRQQAYSLTQSVFIQLQR